MLQNVDLCYALLFVQFTHRLPPLNTTFMAYFKDSNSRGRGFGGGGFGGNKFGGSRGGSRGGFGGRGSDRGPAEMHPATCSQCNSDCEVPFKPNGKKPVLCHKCFKGNDGGDEGSREFSHPRFERKDSRDFQKKSFGERGTDRFDRGERDGDSSRRSTFDAVCSDCGSECEVPFKPNGSKPVYCKDCYGAHSPNGHDESTGGKSYRNNDRESPRARASSPEGGCCGGNDKNDLIEKLNMKIDRLTLIVTSFIASQGKQDVELDTDSEDIEE